MPACCSSTTSARTSSSGLTTASTSASTTASVYIGEDLVPAGATLDVDDVVRDGPGPRRAGRQLRGFTPTRTEHLRREQELLLDGHGRARASRPRWTAGRSSSSSATSTTRATCAAAGLHPRDQPGAGRGRRGRRRAARRRAHPDLRRGGTEWGETCPSGVDRALAGRRDRGPRVARPAARLPSGSSARRRAGRFAAPARARTPRCCSSSKGAELIVGRRHAREPGRVPRPARGGLAQHFPHPAAGRPRLVDAKAAARLHGGRLRAWHLALLCSRVCSAVGVSVAATPVGAAWWQDLQDALRPAWDTATGWGDVRSLRYRIVTLTLGPPGAGGRDHPRQRSVAG